MKTATAIVLTLGLAATACVSAVRKAVYDPPKLMIVKADVADVRSEPVRAGKKYEFDPKQETQVTKGERVFVYEKKGGWMRVECPDQIEFTHKNDWQGYPGWIEAKALSDNISLESKITPPVELDKDLRAQILSEARRHQGAPYLWGGRSLHDPADKKTLTGVDCSGLVNWSYRRVGWLVPRDAHEQWMKARKIERSELKPADLVFYANADKPEKIVHVALYLGNDLLLEAPQSGENVRERPIDQATKVTANRIVYFGTFFPEVP